jgi:hypothetical protein
MDYAVLKLELEKPEYAGLSSVDAATKLNEKSILSQDGKLAPVESVWLFLARAGLLPIIKKASENEASPLHQVAYATMTFLTGPVREFNLKDPMAQQLMDGLIQAGVLTAEQKTTLSTLSDKRISPAEVAGITEVVMYWDVERARAL